MATPRKLAKKKGYATWNEAKVMAASWSEAVIKCRTRGHAWEQDVDHPENGTREGRNTVVHFYCSRGCEVTKKERWDARGLIVKKSMSYPKDSAGNQSYLSDAGYIDREAKGAIRLATLGL